MVIIRVREMWSPRKEDPLLMAEGAQDIDYRPHLVTLLYLATPNSQ